MSAYRVGFAFGLEEECFEAFKVYLDEFHHADHELTLIHVMKVPKGLFGVFSPGNQDVNVDKSKFQSALDKISQTSLKYSQLCNERAIELKIITSLQKHSVAKDIIEVCHENQIDWLVMGGRNMSSISAYFFDSVSHEVAQNIQIPFTKIHK